VKKWTVLSDPDQLTACERAAEEARERPGLYVPQCDAQGNYEPMQFHASTGARWCVDEHGREVTGTRTPPGKPDPDCSEYNGN